MNGSHIHSLPDTSVGNKLDRTTAG